MLTKATTLNGSAKTDAKYLALIDKYLAEIKAIHEDNARKQSAGQKVMARIDRNLKEIQAIIQRVEAAL